MENHDSVSVDGTNEGIDIVIKPTIGMTFLSEQKAYEYYNHYGGTMGFSIRRETSHKSKQDKSIILSRRFVCSKEGHRKKDKRDRQTYKPRAETRTNCPARMGIARLPNGHYECRYFDDVHNHQLHTLATTHFMRSQLAISNIDGIAIELADGSGIKSKSTFDFLGMQVGGTENLGFTKQDLQNYLRTKRQRDLEYGDAGALGKYFEGQARDNPSFSYSMQYDVNEQVTNIFWADPRMIIDYQLFGDVVSFDTTFCTNKEYRPLAIFAGFNHHRGAVIFGAALLYDETIDSFKWLFERFLDAHGQKKPITIFTDQDQAMAAALSEVLPNTRHGLCTWHMLQNGITHHGNLMRDGSSFLKELKRCMYEYVDEGEFEMAWKKFRDEYPSEKSSWLDKIYGIKEKWAKCYMKDTFNLGVRSTQISESINADMKDEMGILLDVNRFFKQFERVLKSKRDNELKDDFEARNKLLRNLGCKSPILTQVGKVYTPYAYEIFLEECTWIICCYLKTRNENDVFCEYTIGVVNEEGVDQRREFTVIYNVSERSVECSCKKFESMGIQCCHALRILQHLCINELPARYILRRWTQAARSLVVEESKGKQVVEDVRLDYTRRFRYAMAMYVPIVTKACLSLEGFDAVVSNGKLLSGQVDTIGIDVPTTETSTQCIEINKCVTLKRKEGRKGGKRFKSWHEKRRKQRNSGPKNRNLQATQFTPECNTPHATEDTMQFTWNSPHATEDTMQFTWNSPNATQEHLTQSTFTWNAPQGTQEPMQHLTQPTFMWNDPHAYQEHLSQPTFTWNSPHATQESYMSLLTGIPSSQASASTPSLLQASNSAVQTPQASDSVHSIFP